MESGCVAEREDETVDAGERQHPLRTLALSPPPQSMKGAALVDADLIVEHVPGVACCQVFARRDRAAEVDAELQAQAMVDGFDLGRGPECLPLAPGQWLLLSGGGGDGELCAYLSSALAGLADVSDQGHARTLFRIRGRHASDLLARGCTLDLQLFETPTEGWHPRRRAVAQTLLLGIPVVIYHDQTGPGFNVIVYPGFAMALWELLREAAYDLPSLFCESDCSLF
jgi:methylglutamate dehydrogenase subunit D